MKPFGLMTIALTVTYICNSCIPIGDNREEEEYLTGEIRSEESSWYLRCLFTSLFPLSIYSRVLYMHDSEAYCIKSVPICSLCSPPLSLVVIIRFQIMCIFH